VDADTLLKLIRSKNFKKVVVTQVDYKRNIMCQIGNAAKDKGDDTEYRTENIEYLILIEK
jgi:hypothetical protein